VFSVSREGGSCLCRGFVFRFFGWSFALQVPLEGLFLREPRAGLVQSARLVKNETRLRSTGGGGPPVSEQASLRGALS